MKPLKIDAQIIDWESGEEVLPGDTLVHINRDCAPEKIMHFCPDGNKVDLCEGVRHLEDRNVVLRIDWSQV